MPCSLTTLVASAKLIIWEHKSSLSFTELFAHCFLPLHLTLLQSLHLRILQRTVMVGWGKTWCSSFPDLLFLLDPTNMSACYGGYLPNLSGTRISERCQPYGVLQSLLTQHRGFYQWHSSEWQPFQLLEPLSPELLQWDFFIYFVFWNFCLTKILYSAWFFYFFFPNPLLALELVLWMFYLEPYTLKKYFILYKICTVTLEYMAENV